MGLVRSLINGVWGYVLVGVFSAVVSGFSVGSIEHKLALAKYEALQLKDAQNVTKVATEQAKAVAEVKDKELAIAHQATAAAVDEAGAQARIHNKVITITKEIPVDKPVYITKTTTEFCIPVGLVWMFNNAVTVANSSGSSDLGQPPTGESYDACSTVPLSAFTETLVTNFGIGAQNAEQLDALEAAITAEVAKINEKPPEVSP